MSHPQEEDGKRPRRRGVLVAAAVGAVVVVVALVLGLGGQNNSADLGRSAPDATTAAASGSPATTAGSSTSGQPGASGSGQPSASGSSQPSAPKPAQPGTSTPGQPSASSASPSTSKRTPANPSKSPISTAKPTPVAPSVRETTKAPLDEPAELDNGVTVKVARVEAVEGEAQGPGEVAGPALRVSIAVTNDTPESLSMDLALANLYYGADNQPAGTQSGPGLSPLVQPISAGAEATGTYVFAVPVAERSKIRIEFSYTTAAPIVLFSGSV